jgi:hypothetical protein
VREIEVPHEIAFMFRNRLKLYEIPYEDIFITKIAVPEEHYERCLDIIEDLKRRVFE